MDAIITRYEMGIDIVFNSLYNGTTINAKREFFHYSKYRFYWGMSAIDGISNVPIDCITIKDNLGNTVHNIIPQLFSNCNTMTIQEFYDYLLRSAYVGCQFPN